MTRAEFVSFVQATFNAMDMITPAEGATAVIKAFDEYDAALRACADALAPSAETVQETKDDQARSPSTATIQRAGSTASTTGEK